MTPEIVWTEDAMIESLQAFERKFDRVPSVGKYGAWARETGRPSASLIVKRFGAWADAIELAGMEPNHGRARGTGRTIEDYQSAIRWAAEELGYTPSARKYDRVAKENSGLPSASAVLRKYRGHWSSALEDAGLAPAKAPDQA